MKPKWHRGLTKAQIKHVEETAGGGVRNKIASFWINRARQKEQGIECFLCDDIERTLNKGVQDAETD